MRERLLLWTSVTAWWLLMGGVWITQFMTMAGAEGQAVDARHVVAMQMTSALLWVPITVGLLWVVRRRPVVRGDLPGALGVLLLAVLAVLVLRAFAVVALNPLVHWYPGDVPGWAVLMRTSVFNNFMTTCMIVGVVHAVVFADRAQRAEKRENLLNQARLGSLTAQLNPHFLFNALNSTAELVHSDPDAADRMLVNLGTLLRNSLRREGEQEVALVDELDLLAHYLDIEKARLGPRLRVAMQVEKDVLQARVPHLILQPLVENAVRHAVAKRSTPGQIRISARREAGRLLLRVTDDGSGSAEATAVRGSRYSGDALPQAPRSEEGSRDLGEEHRCYSSSHEKPASSGIGLRNTRERLDALYGGEHRFEMSGCEADGTEVNVEIPFRTEVAA